MSAYYNEIDPQAAEWLRALILFGHIAPGDVDERSILDVNPDDLRGYKQCHFFAGIGVWSYALRRAGWDDDRPIWTGSCPCQPFSAAGKGGGFDDERHLWPAFHWLIDQCRPDVVFGEQVASKDGLAWLDLVHADLEATGYAVGAVDTCAAGFGAPHIRQRLYWSALAHARGERLSQQPGQRGTPRPESGAHEGQALVRTDAPSLRPADAEGDGHERRGQLDQSTGRDGTAYSEYDCGLADANGRHARTEGLQRGGQYGQQPEDASPGDGDRRPGPTNGLWGDADWLGCRDGKWRPVEPGTFPLAHGASARVGRLRGYGNAIVSAQAQGFIEAVMDAL